MLEKMVIGSAVESFIVQLMQFLTIQKSMKCAVCHCRGAKLHFFCWPMLGVARFDAFVRRDSWIRNLKTVMNRTSYRPPNSHHDLILVQFRLWESPRGPRQNPVEKRVGFVGQKKRQMFSFSFNSCGTYRVFALNGVQRSSGRVVDVEFFLKCLQMFLVNFWWSIATHFILKTDITSVKLFNLCVVRLEVEPSPHALVTFQVASAALWFKYLYR